MSKYSLNLQSVVEKCIFCKLQCKFENRMAKNEKAEVMYYGYIV